MSEHCCTVSVQTVKPRLCWELSYITNREDGSATLKSLSSHHELFDFLVFWYSQCYRWTATVLILISSSTLQWSSLVYMSQKNAESNVNVLAFRDLCIIFKNELSKFSFHHSTIPVVHSTVYTLPALWVLDALVFVYSTCIDALLPCETNKMVMICVSKLSVIFIIHRLHSLSPCLWPIIFM